MERGANTHGPRIDDDLARAAEPLERGAPVEPRTEEFREQEGAADDEPAAEGRLPGRRRGGAGAMDADELAARSELARSVSPSAFPADRDALLASARRNQAARPVLDCLARLPPGRAFENVEQVWQALGGGAERRG